MLRHLKPGKVVVLQACLVRMSVCQVRGSLGELCEHESALLWVRTWVGTGCKHVSALNGCEHGLVLLWVQTGVGTGCHVWQWVRTWVGTSMGANRSRHWVTCSAMGANMGWYFYGCKQGSALVAMFGNGCKHGLVLLWVRTGVGTGCHVWQWVRTWVGTSMGANRSRHWVPCSAPGANMGWYFYGCEQGSALGDMFGNGCKHGLVLYGCNQGSALLNKFCAALFELGTWPKKICAAFFELGPVVCGCDIFFDNLLSISCNRPLYRWKVTDKMWLIRSGVSVLKIL